MYPLGLRRPPGCYCGPPDYDSAGRVLRLSTCPVCTKVALDALRGVDYAIAYTKGGDSDGVLLRQRDFFRA